MNVLYSILVAAALAVPHVTQQGTWRGDDGKPSPNTESRKSIRGFGGWLLVTPDQDWREKWSTPSGTVPRFNEAHAVQRGGKLTVLIFLANPALTAAGEADVTCDLEVVRPTGTHSIQDHDVMCLKGELHGAASSVYLAAPALAFTGEAADPLGEWLVRVTLKDNVRHVSMSLKTSFTLSR